MHQFAVLVSFILLCLLVPARADDPTSQWPAEACTDKSFTIPGWIVRSLTVTADHVANISIVNRVTNDLQTATCVMQGEGHEGRCTFQGSEGSNLTGTIKNASEGWRGQWREGFMVSVTDAWSCDDKKTLDNEPKRMNFKASGSGFLDRLGNGVNYRTDPWLIRGSLLEPVAITPDLAGSEGWDNQNCGLPYGSWRIDADYWNNTWPTPPSNVMGLGLNLVVTNTNANFTRRCNPVLSPDPYSPPSREPFSCGGDMSNEWHDSPRGIGEISTYASFAVRLTYPYFLGINQTYFCERPGSMRPLQISTVTTYRSLPLKCTSTDHGKTQDARDMVETHCAAKKFEIIAATIRRTNLPPFSLTDPKPSTGGCTIDSMVAPHWSLSQFSLLIPDKNSPDQDQSQAAVLTFRLSVHAQVAEISARVELNVSNDPASPVKDEWHPCDVSTTKTPGCRFKFDLASNKFTVNQEWLCNDKDKDTQIYFNATGSPESLPKPKCEDHGEQGTLCEFIGSPPGAVVFRPSEITPGTVWKGS